MVGNFYRDKEQISCRFADRIICLSEHDRDMLQTLMQDDIETQRNTVKRDDYLSISSRRSTLSAMSKKIKNILILPPPLRGDILDLAQKNTLDSNENYTQFLPPEAANAIKSTTLQPRKKRLFISCVVRLSPEKSPHHFVSLIQKLGGVDFLRRNGLIPLLCGAKSVGCYADQVLADFEYVCSRGLSQGSVWPYVVIKHFLGPKELAAVLTRTAINIHPCFYDAYGMTLVESAAFGVPSIVNNGGKVGAVSLLGSGKGCIDIDLERILEYHDDKKSNDCCYGSGIEELKTLISKSSRKGSHESRVLGAVAEEARSRALNWDEMTCFRSLVAYLNKINADS